MHNFVKQLAHDSLRMRKSRRIPVSTTEAGSYVRYAFKQEDEWNAERASLLRQIDDLNKVVEQREQTIRSLKAAPHSSPETDKDGE